MNARSDLFGDYGPFRHEPNVSQLFMDKRLENKEPIPLPA